MSIRICLNDGDLVLVPWVAAFLVTHWQRTLVVQRPAGHA